MMFDAAVVIAEILLDLHAMRSKSTRLPLVTVELEMFLRLEDYILTEGKYFSTCRCLSHLVHLDGTRVKPYGHHSAH